MIGCWFFICAIILVKIARNRSKWRNDARGTQRVNSHICIKHNYFPSTGDMAGLTSPCLCLRYLFSIHMRCGLPRHPYPVPQVIFMPSIVDKICLKIHDQSLRYLLGMHSPFQSLKHLLTIHNIYGWPHQCQPVPWVHICYLQDIWLALSAMAIPQLLIWHPQEICLS